MLAGDKVPNPPTIKTFWHAPEYQSTLSERVNAIPAAAKNTFNRAIDHVKNAPKKELLKLALEPLDIVLITYGTWAIYYQTNSGMEAINSFMLNLALNLKFVSLIETAKSVGSIFASKSYCKIAAFLLSLYLASGAAATSYQGALSAVTNDAPFQLNFSTAGIVIGAVIILLLSAMFPAKALGDFFIHTVKAFKETHQDEHEYDEAAHWLSRLINHTVPTDNKDVSESILYLLTQLRISEPEKLKNQEDLERALKEFKEDVIAIYKEGKNLPHLTSVAFPTKYMYVKKADYLIKVVDVTKLAAMFKGKMPFRERIYKQIIPQSLGMILSPAVTLVVINMLTNTAAKAVKSFTGKEVSVLFASTLMIGEGTFLAALIPMFIDSTWNTIFKATNQFKASQKKEAITTLLTYLGTAFAATISASTVLNQAKLTAPIINRFLEVNVALLALSSLAANAPAAAESSAKLVNHLTHFLLGNPPATAVDYLSAINKAFLNALLENPQDMKQIMARIKNITSPEGLAAYRATLPNSASMPTEIDAQIEGLKTNPNSTIYGTDSIRLRDGKLEYRVKNQVCTFKAEFDARKKEEATPANEGTSLINHV